MHNVIFDVTLPSQHYVTLSLFDDSNICYAVHINLRVCTPGSQQDRYFTDHRAYDNPGSALPAFHKELRYLYRLGTSL